MVLVLVLALVLVLVLVLALVRVLVGSVSVSVPVSVSVSVPVAVAVVVLISAPTSSAYTISRLERRRLQVGKEDALTLAKLGPGSLLCGRSERAVAGEVHSESPAAAVVGASVVEDWETTTSLPDR